jgi:hypothetical protein
VKEGIVGSLHLIQKNKVKEGIQIILIFFRKSKVKEGIVDNVNLSQKK